MGLLLPFSAHTGVVPIQPASTDVWCGYKTKKVTPPKSTVRRGGAGLLKLKRQENDATGQASSATSDSPCRPNEGDTSWLSYQLVTIVNGLSRG